MSDEIKWRAGEVEWLSVGRGQWVCLDAGHYLPLRTDPNTFKGGRACLKCEELASLREDKARLDWWEKVSHVDSEHSLSVFTGGEKGAVVWDQYHGPNVMGTGPDLRAALDAARKESSNG